MRRNWLFKEYCLDMTLSHQIGCFMAKKYGFSMHCAGIIEGHQRGNLKNFVGYAVRAMVA